MFVAQNLVFIEWLQTNKKIWSAHIAKVCCITLKRMPRSYTNSNNFEEVRVTIDIQPAPQQHGTSSFIVTKMFQVIHLCLSVFINYHVNYSYYNLSSYIRFGCQLMDIFMNHKLDYYYWYIITNYYWLQLFILSIVISIIIISFNAPIESKFRATKPL